MPSSSPAVENKHEAFPIFQGKFFKIYNKVFVFSMMISIPISIIILIVGLVKNSNLQEDPALSFMIGPPALVIFYYYSCFFARFTNHKMFVREPCRQLFRLQLVLIEYLFLPMIALAGLGYMIAMSVWGIASIIKAC